MTITQNLAEILGDVDRPGDFFVSGCAEFLAPRIEVEGVGPIALPLLPGQAKQLIKAATRAPYGRGADTVADTKVRRTWQIEASGVSIGGKHWAKTLDSIVERAAEGLGVAGPVTAELYKLLVYDKGSFFISHRDTEKAPGMFATLVLALPSQSKGGELVVRHKDRETRLDLACEEPSEIAFAAFYADCVHEVLPVTSGYRATLVFNLLRKAKGEAPQPPSYEAEADKVTRLLRGWVEENASDSIDAAAAESAESTPPEKLVIPLEHAYTPAELAFDKLKGSDAAVARLLATAAPQAGCDVHLALLTIWESGSAEYNGRENWHYRRGRRDSGLEENASEFDVVEVHDWSKTLSDWRRPDGSSTTLGKLPLEDNEVSPPDALEDMEPDEEHFHEATGNEGASFDRTYARAALVVWPSSRILAILNQGGLEATLPFLGELVDKFRSAGAKNGLPHKRQAEELSGHMIATWPVNTWHARDRSEPSDLGHLLSLLARLGDPTQTERMLEKLMSRQGHDKADNPAILEALAGFEPAAAAGWLKKIVAAHAVEALGPCGALLAGAVNGRFAKTPAQLSGAAQTLLDQRRATPLPLRRTNGAAREGRNPTQLLSSISRLWSTGSMPGLPSASRLTSARGLVISTSTAFWFRRQSSLFRGSVEVVLPSTPSKQRQSRTSRRASRRRWSHLGIGPGRGRSVASASIAPSYPGSSQTLEARPGRCAPPSTPEHMSRTRSVAPARTLTPVPSAVAHPTA